MSAINHDVESSNDLSFMIVSSGGRACDSTLKAVLAVPRARAFCPARSRRAGGALILAKGSRLKEEEVVVVPLSRRRAAEDRAAWEIVPRGKGDSCRGFKIQQETLMSDESKNVDMMDVDEAGLGESLSLRRRRKRLQKPCHQIDPPLHVIKRHPLGTDFVSKISEHG